MPQAGIRTAPLALNSYEGRGDPMHVPHSIRLTIQLTIDSESFRELTNTTEERGRSTISFTR